MVLGKNWRVQKMAAHSLKVASRPEAKWVKLNWPQKTTGPHWVQVPPELFPYLHEAESDPASLLKRVRKHYQRY